MWQLARGSERRAGRGGVCRKALLIRSSGRTRWLSPVTSSTASLAVKVEPPSANLMEHSFEVYPIVFKSNIRDKRDSCKQQILLLLLCCLNGSLEDSLCWARGVRRRRNVLEGVPNAMTLLNILRKFGVLHILGTYLSGRDVGTYYT